MRQRMHTKAANKFKQLVASSAAATRDIRLYQLRLQHTTLNTQAR